MSRIRKPCGTEEEFDRKRLERSIESAGVRTEVARKIAQDVNVTDGLSTDIIRNSVAGELGKIDPKLSRTYMATENLVMKREPRMPQGVAQVESACRAILGAGEGLAFKPCDGRE